MATGVLEVAAGAALELREQIELANAAWSAYAAARGMTLLPGRTGWTGTRMPSLAGVMDDVPVALEMIPGTSGAESFGVRASARPAATLLGHVEVTRVGLLNRVARLFGSRGLKTGDAAFDQAFVVKATDENTAHMLLSPRVRAGLLATAAHRLAYDDGGEHGHPPTLLLDAPLANQDLAAMDRVIRLVAMVALGRTGEEPYR